MSICALSHSVILQLPAQQLFLLNPYYSFGAFKVLNIHVIRDHYNVLLVIKSKTKLSMWVVTLYDIWSSFCSFVYFILFFNTNIFVTSPILVGFKTSKKLKTYTLKGIWNHTSLYCTSVCNLFFQVITQNFFVLTSNGLYLQGLAGIHAFRWHLRHNSTGVPQYRRRFFFLLRFQKSAVWGMEL